ncbi:MAG: preprotein translocase subunit SecG [Lachnospiraceae bacterium]|nr:preprotein translocase subunit SecG [Lachnospiraceae bacterium]
MTALKVIVTLIYVLVCIALVIIVLLQEGKSDGLGALNGSTGTSYWEKNKGRSAEGAISTITKILAAVFIVLSVVLNVVFQ